MKFSAATAVALASCASAFPHMVEDVEKRQNTHPYILNNNNPNAVRSPCPGTNTLANHGFINRNGICVTKFQYQQGFLDAFGVDFSVTDAGTTNAINLCSAITGRTCTCFNLDMLAFPHQIEHDASLSRRDKKYPANQNADNQRFNQTIWDRTLQIYGSDPHIGPRLANTARQIRVQQARVVDLPGWFQENVGGSLAEHSFILESMHDPAVGGQIMNNNVFPQARMDWVNHWFVNMELPTALGWRKPTPAVNINKHNSIANLINTAPTQPAPRGNNPFQKSHPPPIPNAPNKRSVVSDDAWTEEVEVELKYRGVAPNVLSVASAAAVAKATPPPVPIDAYSQVISPETWSARVEQNSAHVESFQAAFDEAIANIQAGKPPTQ